jgi:3-methyladenine DNA glycosylase AlkD
VAPGIGPTHGVRSPLQAALGRSFRAATRRDPPTPLLSVADRLLREPEREARWFALPILARTLEREPERSWQLLRRAAREADDWITIDSLAHPFGKGILAEPYRWAELEQLVYSPSRWERRLVGSTIATLPFIDRTAGRTPASGERGLAILAELIGDAEPDVAKALAWAYRSMAMVDPHATAAALEAETTIARRDGDAHRAWVIRDALGKLPPPVAQRIRERLAGLRRRPGAPSSSRAASIAAGFGGLPDPARFPEPPPT